MASFAAARLALVAGLIAFLMLAAQPATGRHGAGAGERSPPPPPPPPASAVASGTPVVGARPLPSAREFKSLRFSPVPPSAPSVTYDSSVDSRGNTMSLDGGRRRIRT